MHLCEVFYLTDHWVIFHLPCKPLQFLPLVVSDMLCAVIATVLEKHTSLVQSFLSFMDQVRHLRASSGFSDPCKL